MKKKIFAAFLAATMVIASALTTFAASGYETVKELTFDNAEGLKGYTAGYIAGDKYNLTEVQPAVSDGALKPAGTSGAIVDGTFDATKGFRITVTVKLPDGAEGLGNDWFRSIITVVDDAPILGSEQTGALKSYSINGVWGGKGFQAHAHNMGEDLHTWGGNGADLAVNAEHVITMTVLPTADGSACTVTMTADGEEYVIPNLVSEAGSKDHIDSFPNYLTDSMSIILGSTVYGDSYPYDILDVKVEKVVEVEDKTTEAPTTEAPTTAGNAGGNNGGAGTGTPSTADASQVLPMVIVAAAALVLAVAMKKKVTE